MCCGHLLEDFKILVGGHNGMCFGNIQKSEYVWVPKKINRHLIGLQQHIDRLQLPFAIAEIIRGLYLTWK